MATKKLVSRRASNEDATKFIRADEFAQFYCNHVDVRSTAFDIAIWFGEAFSDQQTGDILIQQKARVTMSPVEALLLSKFLANSLEAYENKHGKIVIPDAIKEDLPLDTIQ